MEKHVEQALSSNESSRTEIKGSSRTSRDPAATSAVTANPRPEDAAVATSSRELASFAAVEAVTDDVVIAAMPSFLVALSWNGEDRRRFVEEPANQVGWML
jgi:hypothetical protein